MKNWSDSYRFQCREARFVRAVEEVCEVVRRNCRVRGLGIRHSFNGVADAERGVLVSLKHLNRLLALRRHDGGRWTAVVEGGMNYGVLCAELASFGLALPNLASLPHISVAGAVATATHGSGDALQCLTASVSAVTLVTASGEVREFRRGDPEFDGVVVGLGAFGVVVELTLDLVEEFEIEVRVSERLSLDALPAAGYAAVTSSAYSTSLFTDWQNRTFTQVWMKSLPGRPPLDLAVLGARPAVVQRHPVQGSYGEPSLRHLIDPVKCVRQLGEPGPWYLRLPHFRLDAEPSSSGAEYQSEYVIPREHATDAFEALFAMGDLLRPFLQISEVRTVDADVFWLSPVYGRRSVGIHFTWRNDPAVMGLLPHVERALAPFAPRPHWAKLFTFGREAVDAAYAGAKLQDARNLMLALDPDGKFRNEFVRDRLGV